MLGAACSGDDGPGRAGSGLPAGGLPAGSGASDEVELLTGTYDLSLRTSLGDIALEIDANAAPLAATNFVLHTRDGYYDGVTFHRVVAGFMIQGGDPGGTGSGGESVFGNAFADEPNELTMDRGVVAMANSGPDTNGSQFFIVQAQAGTPHLLGKHTAFGHVTQGMDVVDAIAAVATDDDDRPLSPVTMTPVEL
jgi:peptidyl-prolyl cis-trans isomerase B (cyclophilin B)